MNNLPNKSLQEKMEQKRSLRALCRQAVAQQIQAGNAEATHLRNRKRHLAKQVLKKVPLAAQRSPRRLLQAAAMVLAMWGFVGLSAPTMAEAAPAFHSFNLNGINVGSYAAPAFADIDGDGDLDAFIGERNGTVKYYRNTKVDANPAVQGTGFVADVAGNALAAVAVAGYATPTFADIDGDGDLDAFVGDYYGKVKYYRNTKVDAVAPGTGFVADVAGNPLAAVYVGGYAAPTFADIDGDGDLDAFVGNNRGYVKYYRNTQFDGGFPNIGFVADVAGNPLAAVYVGGYATPTFADIDGDGDLDAFVGNNRGTVKYYRNTVIDGALPIPGFVADVAGNPLVAVAVGYKITPTFADIDGDGDLDAFVGNNAGSVKYYRNTKVDVVAPGTGFVADVAGDPFAAAVAVSRYAAPTFADIDNDGDLDAFVGERTGKVKYYRNTQFDAVAPGTGFVADAAGNPLVAVAVTSNATPAFADIDGDGDLDAFVGERYGTVKYYRNTQFDAVAPGTGFVTDVAGNPLVAVAVGRQAVPTFADIDGDGDLDAFVGNTTAGTVKYYRNTKVDAVAPGTGFVADVAGNPLVAVAVGRNSAPTFADIDSDGDLDAFVGDSAGAMKYYRNTKIDAVAPGTGFVTDVAGNPLAGFGVGRYAVPTFADIDGDGDLDAFVGNNVGGVNYFKNFDPSPVTSPDALVAVSGASATTVDVTLNDTFKVEGPKAGFTITAFDAASANGGTVTSNGNNSFKYISAAGFLGADSFTYTLSDGAANTAVGTVNVTIIADTIPPVITINGTSPVAVEAGATYADALATVTDNVDAPNTALIGVSTVNTAALGTYTVTYNATDAAGNAATQVVRTVNVVDTTAPVITAPANLTVTATLLIGVAKTDAAIATVLASATATDNVGVTTSITNNAPAIFPVGVTTVTYTASDAAGNVGTAIQTVTVAIDDTDADGLPDAWENYQFGNLTTATSTSDSDGDGFTDVVEFTRGSDPQVAEAVRVQAQRRIPPMLETLTMPEDMYAGSTYTLDWKIMGYDSAYTTFVAMFDCTGIVAGACGNNYGDSNRFYSATVASSGTLTAPWNYGVEVANYFSYSHSFTVPAARADTTAWPAAGTPIVVRFYQKSSNLSDTTKPSISLLMPGGITNTYYDNTGRRIQKRICPVGGCI